MPMFSRELKETIRRAIALAAERKHEYATLEHLLLALTEDQDARKVLIGCGANIQMLRHEVIDFLDVELDGLVVDDDAEIKPDESFDRIIDRAVKQTQLSGKAEVDGVSVLVSLLSDKRNRVLNFLQKHNVSKLDVINFSSHGIIKKHENNIKDGGSPIHMEVSAAFDLVLNAISNEITVRFHQDGNQALIEDLQSAIAITQADANWSWRVTEMIERIVADAHLPPQLALTEQELDYLAKEQPSGAVRVGRFLNRIEYEPLDESLTPPPAVRFLQAQHINPIEMTIVVAASSITLVIMSAVWSARTWQRAKSDKEFNDARADLLRKVTSNLQVDDPAKLARLEKLIIGLLNSSTGISGGDERFEVKLPGGMISVGGTSGTPKPKAPRRKKAG